MTLKTGASSQNDPKNSASPQMTPPPKKKKTGASPQNDLKNFVFIQFFCRYLQQLTVRSLIYVTKQKNKRFTNVI
jgi:hypothetical protein